MTDQMYGNQPNQDGALVDQVTSLISRIKQGLQVHGNDIDLVGIDRNRGVTVRVHKKPENHDQVHEVLATGITEMIKAQIPQVKEVVSV